MQHRGKARSIITQHKKTDELKKWERLAGAVGTPGYLRREQFIDALSRGEHDAVEGGEEGVEEDVEKEVQQPPQQAKQAWREGAVLTKDSWIDHYLARLQAAKDPTVRVVAASVLDDLEGITRIRALPTAPQIVDNLRVLGKNEEEELLLDFLRHAATVALTRSDDSTHSFHYGLDGVLYARVADVSALYRRLQLDGTAVDSPSYHIRELVPRDDANTPVNAFVIVNNTLIIQDVITAFQECLQLACTNAADDVEEDKDDVEEGEDDGDSLHNRPTEDPPARFVVSRRGQASACINTNVVLPFITLRQVVLPLLKEVLRCRVPDLDWDRVLYVQDRDLNRCPTIDHLPPWVIDGGGELPLYTELLRTSVLLVHSPPTETKSDGPLMNLFSRIPHTAPKFVKLPKSVVITYSVDASTRVIQDVQRRLSTWLAKPGPDYVPQLWQNEVRPEMKICRINMIRKLSEDQQSALEMWLNLTCEFCKTGYVYLCFHRPKHIIRSCSRSLCRANPLYTPKGLDKLQGITDEQVSGHWLSHDKELNASLSALLMSSEAPTWEQYRSLCDDVKEHEQERALRLYQAREQPSWDICDELHPVVAQLCTIVQTSDVRWTSARVTRVRRVCVSDNDVYVDVFLEGDGTACTADGCRGLVLFEVHSRHGFKIKCRLCRTAVDLPKSPSFTVLRNSVTTLCTIDTEPIVKQPLPLHRRPQQPQQPSVQHMQDESDSRESGGGGGGGGEADDETRGSDRRRARANTAPSCSAGTRRRAARGQRLE